MQENETIKFCSEKLITCCKLIFICNPWYILWSFFPKEGKDETNSPEIWLTLMGTKSTAGEGSVNAKWMRVFFNITELICSLKSIDAAKIYNWKQKTLHKAKPRLSIKFSKEISN